jgi:hypothetical protein
MDGQTIDGEGMASQTLPPPVAATRNTLIDHNKGIIQLVVKLDSRSRVFMSPYCMNVLANQEII